MAEATQRAGQPRSWSEIPLDLAGLVLRLLPAYADRVRFAAVCPQWRAAARQPALPRQLALPRPLPLLALPNGTFYSLPYGKPFRFPGFGCADFRGAACDSWLVFPRDDGCYLVDPLLGQRWSCRLNPPNADAKHLQGSPYTTWMHMKDKGRKPSLDRLIECSPNLFAAFVGDGTPSFQILVCQPRASSWSVHAYDGFRVYEDMAFCQGKLYALGGTEENLLVVNISQDPSTGDPQISRIGQVINGDPDPSFEAFFPDNTMHKKKLYLVKDESRGALLMMLEADLEHSRWVNVTTLGDDLMLFLGRACSKLLPASQYGMPGDQIFFLNDVAQPESVADVYGEVSTCVNVYDMRTGEVSSPLPMVWKHKALHKTWLFPSGPK